MKPATASRSWAFMATTSRSITSVIRSPRLAGSCTGAYRHRPRRCARVPALDGRGPGTPSRPGAARCRTRTHRDKGNDADFTINLPRCMISRAIPAPSAHHADPDAGWPPGYAYGCAQITRIGTAAGDRHSDLIADDIGGSGSCVGKGK